MDVHLNSLAYKLLAETEAEPAQQPIHKPEPGLMHWLGGQLVTLGQKMQTSGLDVQAAFEDTGYPSLDKQAPA